jgi:peptide/nickel transport system substrate-binding protein
MGLSFTSRGMKALLGLGLVGAMLIPSGQFGSSSVDAMRAAKINHDPNTLIIGSQYGDPQNFDPIATFTLAWGMIGSNIFDPLIYRGPDLKIDPSKGLATSWKYLNPTTLQLKLRKGVTFQDGEPFNADAVKFTFDRLASPFGQKGAQYFQYKNIKEVTVVDPYTVNIINKVPNPVTITELAGYGAMIVPPAYIKKHGNAYFATHPIGTGAYMVTKYTPNAEVDLARYDKYWGGPAKMAKVIYDFIPTDATRLADLQTGRIDIMQKVATGQVSVVKGDSNLKLLPVGSPTVYGVFINSSKAPLNNVLVRQAINYAIDTSTIVKDILDGYGVPVATWQSAASFGNDPSLKPYPYDPTKAKALLAQAHFDGSKAINFTIDGTDTVFKQEAEVMVAELQQVGIKVNLQTVAPTVLYNTDIPKRTYDMAEFGWGGWTLDFDNTAYSLYYTGQFYNMGYSNPTLDKLLTAARSTLDSAKRLAAYKQADAILYHDVPNAALYQTVNLWAETTNVHNFIAAPDDRLELHDVSLS